MKLILNGSYAAENCPPKLLIAHSVVLVKHIDLTSTVHGFSIYFSLFVSLKAKEMERQRKLLMEGKLEKCPKELSNHPVFMVNQMTNKIVLNKRSKVTE